MCQSCDFVETLETINTLLNDDGHRFVWAFDVLTGIKERIQQSNHATENQIRAVENIESAGKRRR